MNAYKIHLPGYKPFTMITETPECDVPAAVFEKFGEWPDGVELLQVPKKKNPPGV